MRSIVIPLFGMMFITFPVQADWNIKVPVNESIEPVGEARVLSGYYGQNDTTFVAWAGVNASTDTNVYLTAIWNEESSLQFSTRQVSESSGSATHPRITRFGYPDRLFMTWLEPAANADSVIVMYSFQTDSGMLAPDTLTTIQYTTQYTTEEGWSLFTYEFWDIFLLYTVPGETGFRKIYFNPDSLKVVKEALGSIQVPLSDDSITAIRDFGYCVFWDEDVPATQITALVDFDSTSAIATGWMAGREDELTMWDIEKLYQRAADGKYAFTIDQGPGDTPAAAWITPTDNASELTHLYSERFQSGIDPPWTKTEWSGLNDFQVQPSAPEHLIVRDLDESKTLFAWDAVVDGNREILLRSDKTDDPVEQITNNAAEDTHPVIVHFPTENDSFQVVVLWQSDRDGENRLWATTSKVPVAVRDEPVIPQEIHVSQNYPNPFNAETTIEYSVPNSGRITVSVFNIRGQLLRSYNQRIREPGEYEFRWDGITHAGSTAGSGIYLIRFQYNDREHRLTLVKNRTVVLLK